MGEEIRSNVFTQADFDQFYRNLQAETHLLRQWFNDGVLAAGRDSAGFEVECWLVSSDFQPAAINEEFLTNINNPLVVPELSKFNVELNSTPHALSGSMLKTLSAELNQTWQDCQQRAQAMNAHIMMIGILPTLQNDMLTMEQMSPMQRYRALNEQILRLRHGKPMLIDIEAKDHLMLSHNDVMFESATTSIQVHLQMDPDIAIRYYNASLILSAITVAIAANSPFLFGLDLWDETRIPLFEQAVSVGSVQEGQQGELRRVTFGSGYVNKSLYECFLENMTAYPVILPSIFQQNPASMNHLRLHNGTIWRWNRPLVGLEADGRVHLRLEHRVMAAGPTPDDIMANIAFFIGMVRQLARQETPPENRLTFEEARNNFYRAAKDGLNARIKWLNGQDVNIQTLILDRLIPLARQGLIELGLDADDIQKYLIDIIVERARTQQNGASWQRQFIDKYPGDFSGLTRAYFERQHEANPVHTWSL